MLNKIGDALEKFLMPIADSMNKNKYILAIRDAFTVTALLKCPESDLLRCPETAHLRVSGMCS